MSFIISRVESQTERSALTIIYNQIDYLHVISVYFLSMLKSIVIRLEKKCK